MPPPPDRAPASAPALLLATANPHKLAELRAIFATPALLLLSLDQLGPTPPEPAETGDTFEANATIKALAYAAATGLCCLADDSGLEVDALGGAPGVISAHFATDGIPTGQSRAQRDSANNAHLLARLAGTPPGARAARFVCVMALAVPRPAGPELLATFRSEMPGRIGVPPHVPRGEHGFGYDPLFLVGPDHARTSAQLPPQEKNRLSHRARAAAMVARWLADNAHQLSARA
ncbi:MAG: non-canonical purine NTP pyrophosphatase [Isosphaera sp.]|nr:non-canonical purine NTP pyrophosphatase [Isosphaera sp.]